MAIIVVLNSCATYKCRPSKGSKDWAQTDSVRTTLVKVNRTIRYNQGLFITDNGDTIKRNFYGRLKVDSCYMIKI